jgi:alpha-L-glutamate ligase-like protein
MSALFGWIGKWRAAREHASEVLSMNRRNLHFIYPRNAREHFPIADDKLLAKEILVPAGVPMPQTYRVYSYFYELRDLERDLAELRDFVIKPAQGSGGNGIIVVAGRNPDGNWYGVSGKTYTLFDLQKHISDIIYGIYSFDLGDRAIIESRVEQHPEMQALSPLGLADVRIILCDEQPVMSMTRVPTRQSDGKANLHQGAVGVAIDIETGMTTHGRFLGEDADVHPDTGIVLAGRRIPHWAEIREVALRAARAVPLKYLGVDIVVSREGPMLLEINVRPGLEIQNVNQRGMLGVLKNVLENGEAHGH